MRGRDISKNSYEWAGLYIIATFPSRHYDIDDFPAVRDYLLTFDKRKLAQSGEKAIDGIQGNNARKKTNNKWFEVQDSIAYWDDFNSPKIMWAETMRIHKNNRTNFPRFSFCDEPMTTDKTCFIAIAKEHPYFILGFMNSAIGRYSLKRCVSILDDGGYLLQKCYLETVLLPTTSDTEKIQLIEGLVMDALHDETLEVRSKIDNLYYELFSFSQEEIRFIEKDNSILNARKLSATK